MKRRLQFRILWLRLVNIYWRARVWWQALADKYRWSKPTFRAQWRMFWNPPQEEYFVISRKGLRWLKEHNKKQRADR